MMKRTLYLFTFLILLATMEACHKSNKKIVQGKIKRDTIALSSKVTGRILALYVQEGQSAKPGDTLAMLDVPEVTAKLVQARGVLTASSAQRLLADNGYTPNEMKELRAKHAASMDQYILAERSYTRANAMFNDSLLAPQAHDEAFARFQSAKAQLDAVSAELNEAERGTRYEKKLATVGQQDQAGGVLQEVEVAYSERYIIATNYITIETINLRKGELAVAGYPVFSGYIPNSTWFRFTIPESQVDGYKKGDRILVDVPYVQRSFEGRILTILQMPRYADITTAYPDYNMDDAVYEIRIAPSNVEATEELLYNATITMAKKK